jgi:BioD-like phosphotransacetylase family protein
MIPLFVDSLSEYSGRNTVCFTTGSKLREANRKVGFFKPLGVFPTRVEGVLTDEDMVFFKSLLGLDDALDDLCPVVLTQDLLQEVLEGKKQHSYIDKIRASFQKVSAGKEILIVIGIGYLWSGLFLGLSEADFIREVDGKLLLTDRFGWVNQTADRLLAARKELGERLVGVIFNRVEPKEEHFVENVLAGFLRSKGVDVFGTVPEDPKLGAVAVHEILEFTGGKLLCCEDKLNEVVERFSVGAMTAEAALRHFIRIREKAVITGGDRSDIMLAALDTSTKCLILTGNLYPNDVVLSRAAQAGVPVIVVPGDTLATIEKFEEIMGRHSIREKKQVEYAIKLMSRYIDYDAMFKKIGL